MIDQKKRLEEIINELIEVYEARGLGIIPDDSLDKILKEFVHKDNLLNEDKINNIVFEIMLTNEEYRKLPDYYVKEICRETIRKLIEGKK